jgi:hypothetical protein
MGGGKGATYITMIIFRVGGFTLLTPSIIVVKGVFRGG